MQKLKEKYEDKIGRLNEDFTNQPSYWTWKSEIEYEMQIINEKLKLEKSMNEEFQEQVSLTNMISC